MIWFLSMLPFIAFPLGYYFGIRGRKKLMDTFNLRRLEPNYRDGVRWEISFTPPGGETVKYRVKDINEVPEEIRERVRQNYLDWVGRGLQFLGMMKAVDTLDTIRDMTTQIDPKKHTQQADRSKLN